MDGNHRSDQDPPSGHPANTLRDDDTVATPTRGDKARGPNFLFIEKTLRFRFPPMLTGDPVTPPSTLHAHWMCAIQQEFGDAVQIINNKNRIVPTIDPPTRLDPKNIKAHFV